MSEFLHILYNAQLLSSSCLSPPVVAMILAESIKRQSRSSPEALASEFNIHFWVYIPSSRTMTFFLTALLVANYAHFSSSAPHLIERDTSQTVGWVSEPNGRGTVSLVTSCVLTLGVCVWSAMHLNIPPRGESSWQRWVRNIRWGLAGVFGPELVLFIAWKQYLSARAIAKKAQPGAFTRDRDQHMGKTNEKSPQVTSAQV